MADDQMEAHLAVGPVPDSQPGENNERFKPPQPGQEQHLDQEEIGAQRAGDAAQAG